MGSMGCAVLSLAGRILPFAVLTVQAALLPPAAAQQTPLAVLGSGEIGDGFGTVMAPAGDVDGDGVGDVIVGAPTSGTHGPSRGRAWVFSGADLSVLHVLDGTASLQEFGTSVAGAGDVDGDGRADLIVGAPWAASVTTEPGKAFVFSGASGALLLELTGRQAGDRFGAAVTGAGDLDGDGLDDVAVGAPEEDVPPYADAGRVVAFSGASGASILEITGWNHWFLMGTDLVVPGDMTGDGVPDLVVAGSGWQNPEHYLPWGPWGAVFVVSGQTGLVANSVIGPGSYEDYALPFGYRLGLIGDCDGDGARDFFTISGAFVLGAATSFFEVYSGATAAYVGLFETEGSAADSLGDLDGDGRDDILVGESGAKGLFGGSGRVRGVLMAAPSTTHMLEPGMLPGGFLGMGVVVLGDADADGLPEYLASEIVDGPPWTGRILLLEYEVHPVPVLVVPGEGAAATGFGSIVVAAGDVDNDGAPDILVGEPYFSELGVEAGRARVLSGRDGAVLLTVHGDAPGARLGSSVDSLGDLDRDGHADIVVGIPFASPPAPGRVRAYSGATGGLLFELTGASAVDRFGTSLAGVGDVDGDGAPDLLVGSPFDDTGAPNGGAAYLISGATRAPIHVLAGEASFLAFGNTVGGGGDVDGDGVPDLLVGVPNAIVGNHPPTVPGTVRVHSGASGALLHVLEGSVSFGRFGDTHDITGDMDGDGLADVIVGAPGDAGRAHAFSGLSGELLWSSTPLAAGESGKDVAVSGFGDVNRDGRSDILLGLPGTSVAEPLSGDIRVLSGADGSLLRSVAPLDSQAHWGTAVDTLGDLDLDGLPDILAGAELMAGSLAGAVGIWLGGDGSSPWSGLGGALPGAMASPKLQPAGNLVAGEPVSLKLIHAPPFAPAVLVAGFSVLAAPFKGGTMVPAPDVLFPVQLTDGAGGLAWAATWPAGAPSGTQLVIQAWIQDGSAAAGFSASGAILATLP